jgi:Leucine-rich repeat (LRR) protein
VDKYIVIAGETKSLKMLVGALAAPTMLGGATMALVTRSKSSSLNLTAGIYVLYKCIQIFRIIAVIRNCKPLTTLNLRARELAAWPEIDRNVNLVELDLSSNRLASLDTRAGEIARHTYLSRLHLDVNQLRTLPSEFGQLSNLRFLRLGSNQFAQFPLALCQLSQLEELDCNNNQLESLPGEIRAFVNLRFLNLFNNPLTSLPEEIGCLTALEILNLNCNRLTALPRQIVTLTKLTHLLLMQNRFAEFPEIICQLHNLTYIRLDRNQLRTVPNEISQLSRLRSLWISNNQLIRLPASLHNLPTNCIITADENPILNSQDFRGSRPHFFNQNSESTDRIIVALLRGAPRNDNVLFMQAPVNNPAEDEIRIMEDSVQTYLRDNHRRAAENRSEGVDLLKSLMDRYLSGLSDKDREEYIAKIEMVDEEVILACPKMIVEHFLSLSIQLTENNTPFFLHSHLNQFEKIREKRKEIAQSQDQSQIDKLEREVQTLICLINTTLHREASFIVCIQSVLKMFQE